MIKIEGKEIPERAGLVTKVYLCSRCTHIDQCHAEEIKKDGFCYTYDTKNNTLEELIQNQ